ncbi:hypothetical protein VTO42DRAFT_6869 [Malbranchea cinnamomea]
MSKKGGKTLTDDELLAQFDDLNVDVPSGQPSSGPQNTATNDEGQDVLKELEDLAAQRPGSRPATPQVSTLTAKRTTSTATPSAGRSSEDKPGSRKSGDSTRPYHVSMTPADTTTPSESASAAAESPKPQPQQQKSSSGSWWGGLVATASAAMKQAEAAVREIQKNEEAQRLAEQVRGNVGALRGLGGELRTLAMPTFTSLIHTLAPPISSHERLQIHVTHDLSGYPSIDALVYDVFSRVMSQVEGGDLLVVQRGKESAPKRTESTAGWHDGPWWRYVSPGKSRSISAIKGAVVASKLARASAEAYATEYYASRGGIEEAAKQASEILSESNPVRNSDIFLAIQALSQPVSSELFRAGPSAESGDSEGVMEVQEEPEEEIAFALYLHDPIHGINFHTISQAIPRQWIDWLDAPAPEADPDAPSGVVQSTVPEAIAEIIESGGIDPREWIAEWVEDTLTLGLGVIAQRYVARRMGVGEGGVGKGKMKAEKATTVESGAGEAARAL